MARLATAHHPLAELTWPDDDGWFAGSRVLLCSNAVVNTAIVFLHGWGGDAGDTWGTLPTRLRFMPAAARSDAFFLNYASREHSVAACGGRFAGFLLALLREPAETFVNPSLLASATPRLPFAYPQILIVGHSMGAVVARRGLLDIDRDSLTDDERRRMRMLFFAPAHKGSSLPLLVRSGLGLDWLPGSALVGSLLTNHYRSLQDLAEGSGCLEQLEADSKDAREAYGVSSSTADASAHLVSYLRAQVCHAMGDKVVVQDRFDDDLRPSENILHQNHRTICKPGDSYQHPLNALASLLPAVSMPP